MSRMGGRIDYERIATSYDRGRALPPEALEEWRLALSDFLDPAPVDRVLDLGSGTGIWSVLLADWFDAEVVAIEPSEGMRSQAVHKRSHPRVSYLGGEAEHIPIKDSSCSFAWLSTVTHHIPDLGRCARELHRVLEGGGRILIRQAFSGRTHDIVWPRFFPTAHRVLEKRWHTVEATVEALSVAGFEKESLQSVAEVTASNLQAYYERIKTRADSSLTLISDEEFERGLRALRKAADEEPPSPIITRLDLLVLRQRGGGGGTERS